MNEFGPALSTIDSIWPFFSIRFRFLLHPITKAYSFCATDLPLTSRWFLLTKYLYFGVEKVANDEFYG